MGIDISEFYGKKVLTLSGRILGTVKGVMLNMEENRVSHLLLDDVQNFIRNPDTKSYFMKNSISYKRVRKIGESIVISESEE